MSKAYIEGAHFFTDAKPLGMRAGDWLFHESNSSYPLASGADSTGFHTLHKVETVGSTTTKLTSVTKPSFRGALVRLAGDVAMSSGVSLDIIWDHQIYDTDGIHSTATNPARLTVPQGVTMVQLYAGVQFDGGGNRAFNFLKNGAAWSADDASPAGVIGNVVGHFERLHLAGPPILTIEDDYFVLQGLSSTSENITNAVASYFGMKIID